MTRNRCPSSRETGARHHLKLLPAITRNTHPEAVAAFCEAYTAERNRLAATLSSSRSTAERDLVMVKRDHAKLVDAIIAGVPADQLKDKMIALDARRKDLEAQLATAETSPAPLRFHPGMAQTYRERVARLILGLGDGDAMEEAKEALRGLIEKIVLTPAAGTEGADGGLSIDLHGALASLLRLATGAAVYGDGGGKNAFKACEEVSHAFDNIGELVLVAGADNRRQLPTPLCAV